MSAHRAGRITGEAGGAVRVLSIDGGGMRGIIPATLLTELERRLGKPLHQAFDLIAGTSTGGIISLALTKPGPDGKAAYSAAQLVDLYRSKGTTIFRRPFAHTLATAGGLLGPKYPSDGVEEVLKAYFQDTRVGQALTKVMVTSYDTAGAVPYFFKSFRTSADVAAGQAGAAPAVDDFLMWQAARATSAAPTFFPPFPLEPTEPGDPAKALVDGGVFVNNPAACALAEAVRRFPGKKVILASFGTGAEQEQLPYARTRGFGLAGWALPILKVVFDGVADAVDYQLGHVLGDGNYFRFQCDAGGLQMDDPSEAAIQKLTGAAAALARASQEKLDRLASLLG